MDRSIAGFAGPSPESVTVLDVILEYGSGHFVPTALAIERAVQSTGARHIAITGTQCRKTRETAHWLRIVPIFPHENRTAEWRAPIVFLQILGEIGHLAWIINRQLAKASRGSDRVVIRLDWILTRRLSAIALALISFKLANFLNSVLTKPTQPMLWLHIHRKGDMTPLRLFLMKLLRAFRIPSRVSVYSPALSELYSAGFPGHVAEMPGSPVNSTISKMIAEENFCRASTNNGTIVCLLGGQISSEKGYTVFRRLLLTRKDCTTEAGVNIQLRAPKELGLRSACSQIEIVEMSSGYQSEQDYVHGYLTSEFVLMPYRENYRYAASGVFVDAVTLGCMPIVSKQTTMARELIKFGLDELVIDWETGFSLDLIASVAREQNSQR